MAKQSTIKIDVELNDLKVPEKIYWSATDSTADDRQTAKAMLVNFWDGQDKAAMRIDLWTEEMMVDEMVDFYYQCFMGMAETLQRATGQAELVGDMRSFANQFINKFQELQSKQK